MKFINKDYFYILEFTKVKDHWINFKVDRVLSYSDFDEELEIDEDSICNGYIKWDGCMELQDLNYHFCGYSNILQVIIKNIYKEASNNMKNFNKELADFNND